MEFKKQDATEDGDSGEKQAQLKNNPSSCFGISAFDLDHTLVQGNSSSYFFRYLCRQKALPLTQMWQPLIYSIRHRFLGMGLVELHHSVFNKILRGKRLELLETYVDRFVNEYVSQSLYLPAVARLKRAQQLGHYTVILSNSPSFLVKRFAKVLGVNDYYATEYSVDENRRFDKILKILEGKDKAQHVVKIAEKLGVFLDQVSAYSDSIFDLEFLKAAGKPIAVNPDKKLRAISVENQWRII